MKKNIRKLGKSINKANRILLINHVRMDMDAFGSLCAIYDILSQIGKNVKATNDELPLENYAFTGYNEIIDPNLDIKQFNPELIISFDAASPDQLGTSYSNNKEVFDNAEFFVIDHHVTNVGFGKINIIGVNYSSTCELTYEIIHDIKLEKYITPKIATSLISGIYTDTNIFYNTNTSKNTYTVAGKLIELGADFRKPYYEFYKKKTYDQSKLWGEILANHMKKICDGKVVYAMISKNIFIKTNSNDRQLTGLISEFFANIEGVEICFICYELTNNQIKTSLRSIPKHDVSKISQIFGGGGHKQASGFSSNKSLEEVEKELIKEIKKELN